MFVQAQTRLFAAFLGGVLVGVVGLILVAGTDPAAEAADPPAGVQKEAAPVGRYQVFKIDDPSIYCGMVDTTTGKLWKLQGFANPQPRGPTVWKWVPLADGPN
jgi:hypothetical protein